jgi:hypothetical protein
MRITVMKPFDTKLEEKEERGNYNKRSIREVNELLPPQRLVRSSVGD